MTGILIGGFVQQPLWRGPCQALKPLRDMAAVYDAATLVRAAAHFRGKSKAEILEVFRRYVDTRGGHEL